MGKGEKVSYIKVGDILVIKATEIFEGILFLGFEGDFERVGFDADGFRPIYPDKLASDTAMFRKLLNVKSRETVE